MFVQKTDEHEPSHSVSNICFLVCGVQRQAGAAAEQTPLLILLLEWWAGISAGL